MAAGPAVVEHRLAGWEGCKQWTLLEVRIPNLGGADVPRVVVTQRGTAPAPLGCIGSVLVAFGVVVVLGILFAVALTAAFVVAGLVVLAVLVGLVGSLVRRVGRPRGPVTTGDQAPPEYLPPGQFPGER